MEWGRVLYDNEFNRWNFSWFKNLEYYNSEKKYIKDPVHQFIELL